jgi:hypothetical protein
MSNENTKADSTSTVISEQARAWTESAPSGERVDKKEFDAWRQRGAALLTDAVLVRDPETFNIVSLLWLSGDVQSVNEALGANATAAMESITDHPTAKGADAWLETEIPEPGTEEYDAWRSAGLALIGDLLPEDKQRANAVYQRLNG